VCHFASPLSRVRDAEVALPFVYLADQEDRDSSIGIWAWL
jgi:hypothetical protein